MATLPADPRRMVMLPEPVSTSSETRPLTVRVLSKLPSRESLAWMFPAVTAMSAATANARMMLTVLRDIPLPPLIDRPPAGDWPHPCVSLHTTQGGDKFPLEIPRNRPSVALQRPYDK